MNAKGEVTLPGFTEAELKAAYTELLETRVEQYPDEGTPAETTRYELVGAKEYQASIAPPITPEIQRALEQVFAELDQEAEILHPKKSVVYRKQLEGKTPVVIAPAILHKPVHQYLRQMAKDLDALLMGSAAQETP